MSLAIANAFVAAHHRHHAQVVGHRFSIGCLDDDRLCGVAIMGRPVGPQADDGWTLEVTRVATDGTRNACSALYGACRRIAMAMGYARIMTYTLLVEQGISLKASGWTEEGLTDGREWSRPSRVRTPARNPGVKRRWACTLASIPAWKPSAEPVMDSGQLALIEHI